MLTIPFNVLLHHDTVESDPPVRLDSGEIVPLFKPYLRFRKGDRVDVVSSWASLMLIGLRQCGFDGRGDPLKFVAVDDGYAFKGDDDHDLVLCSTEPGPEEAGRLYTPDLTEDLGPDRALALFLVQSARFNRCRPELERSRKSRMDPRDRLAAFEKRLELEAFEVFPPLDTDTEPTA